MFDFSLVNILQPGGYTSYNPLINYKWVEKVALDGTRVIPNSGKGRGEYNAKSYFGRGMKFNGVDQSLGIPLPYTLVGDLVCDYQDTVVYDGSEDNYSDKHHQFIDVKPNTYYKVTVEIISADNLNNAGIRFDPKNWYSFAQNNITDIGTQSFIMKTYDETHVYVRWFVRNGFIGEFGNTTIQEITQDELTVYHCDLTNGQIISTPTIVPMEFYKMGAISSHWMDWIYKWRLIETKIGNTIIYKGSLSETQKDYLRNYPETFLYYDEVTANGETSYVKRSKILNQSELDNVVAHLPMCDTDAYTRDMASFSKDVDRYSSSEDASANTGTTLDATFFSFDGENTDDSVKHKIIASTAFTDGDLVEINLTLSNISGSPKVINYDGGYSTAVNNTLVRGDNLFVVKFSGIDNCALEFNNSVAFSYDYVVTMRKINSLHETENYTTSVREDANRLQYGLQMSSWNRDMLGVPTGFSEYLKGDNNGFATTGWIPKAEDDWTIELVQSYGNIGAHDIEVNGIWDSSYQRIAIGLTSGRGHLRVDFGSLPWEGQIPIDYPAVHFLVVHSAITNKVKIYINGVLSRELGDGKYETPTSGFSLSRYYYVYCPSANDIRLFKVHTKSQDPAKLFDDALNKGLLN